MAKLHNIASVRFALAAALLSACSGEVPLNADGAARVDGVGVTGKQTDRGNDTVIVETPSAKVIGEINLDNGAHLTVSEASNGPLVVTLSAFDANVEELGARMKTVRNAEHLYEVFAPDLEVPSEVTAAVARLAEADIVNPHNNVSSPLEGDPPVLESVVDSQQIVLKEAPRDVNAFINNVCKADMVVESAIGGIYARRPVTCQTERTGSASQTVTASRQVIASFRPYRGTIDQKWYWKNGSSWTLGGTLTAVEGQAIVQIIFPVSVGDIRVDIANASGDGWHWGIETADADPVNQKNLAGSDYYQQACVCGRGLERKELKVEGCTSLVLSGFFWLKFVDAVWHSTALSEAVGWLFHRCSGAQRAPRWWSLRSAGDVVDQGP